MKISIICASSEANADLGGGERTHLFLALII